MFRDTWYTGMYGLSGSSFVFQQPDMELHVTPFDLDDSSLCSARFGGEAYYCWRWWTLLRKVPPIVLQSGCDAREFSANEQR